jgi:hypothetical protein
MRKGHFKLEDDDIGKAHEITSELS